MSQQAFSRVTIFPWLTILSGLALLVFMSGCATPKLQDLTPSQFSRNDSGIYTFEFTAGVVHAGIIEGTEYANLVIDGTKLPMERNPRIDGYSYTYDYRFQPGQTQARYYFEFGYDYVNENAMRRSYGPVYSQLKGVSVVSQYVIQLESSRGPVGSSIGVIGRGFTEFDRVVFNGQEIPTTFDSEFALRFQVPGLPAGQAYPVKLRTGQGDREIGNFKIDQASLSVQPGQVSIRQGERVNVIFTIDFEAPAGGLPISVTTDIPRSVIMPEVSIPAGARSVSVPLEGGQPGNGSIFAEAPGFDQVVIGVSVR